MDNNNNNNSSNGITCVQSDCVSQLEKNKEVQSSSDSSTVVPAKELNAGQVLDPPTPDYLIRPMQLQDIKAVLDLWERYELYEGKHTIQTFMQIDPDGFYVAVDKNTGRVLGCCGGALAHPDTGFIGLYAVQPELLGRGIGLSIYNRVMEHFGNLNVGLYSLEKHLHTYRDKAGFRVQDSIQVIVYENFCKLQFDKMLSKLDDVKVVPITSDSLPAVVDFDQTVVGHRRDRLLGLCLFEPESYAVMAIRESTNQVIGYGHVRLDNAKKLMCGPLYAESQPVAEVIMYHLLTEIPLTYDGVTLMVPDCVPNGHLIAEKLNLDRLYSLPRLFTKHLPVANFQHIYGIHSPNFYPF